MMIGKAIIAEANLQPYDVVFNEKHVKVFDIKADNSAHAVALVKTRYFTGDYNIPLSCFKELTATITNGSINEKLNLTEIEKELTATTWQVTVEKTCSDGFEVEAASAEDVWKSIYSSDLKRSLDFGGCEPTYIVYIENLKTGEVETRDLDDTDVPELQEESFIEGAFKIEITENFRRATIIRAKDIREAKEKVIKMYHADIPNLKRENDICENPEMALILPKEQGISSSLRSKGR